MMNRQSGFEVEEDKEEEKVNKEPIEIKKYDNYSIAKSEILSDIEEISKQDI